MHENDDLRHGAQTQRSVRPWGDIHVVVRNQPCSVDLTHVNPGMRSSGHPRRRMQMREVPFLYSTSGAK